MNKILNRYLIINYLKVLFNVILIFICLGIILNLFEELEFFKNLDVGMSMPFFLTILFIPNLLIKLLPFIIFITTMWYLISINTNKEVLTFKIFGFSNIKIVLILAISSFIFGLLVLVTINPITSSMVRYYEKTKSDYSKDIDHLASINKNGVWIKERKNETLRIVNAQKLDGDFLHQITIYFLDKNNQITKRIEAEKADITSNYWLLEDIIIYNMDVDINKVTQDKYKLYSNYNIKKINSLYRNLDTISFLDLITRYEAIIKKGYSKQLLDEKLNQFISMPIFLFLMVILASIFSIKTSSRTHNFYYVFISIITCVVIYYFKDLSLALGQTNRISLTLSVWMPIIAISIFCSIGIIHINEK